MAQSKTTIVSLAIMLLGHKPIITLDNADDLTVAADQAYDLLLPSVLSSGNWRFATQIAQLSETPEIPPTGSYWTKTYLLPAGYLSNTRIYPQNYTYDIYSNDRIFTNWNGAVWMEYTYMVEANNLPSHFVNYFVYEIAAFLALNSAQKPEYYSVLEAKRKEQRGMAAAIDAKSRPNFSQVDFPVLSHRYIGGIISNAIG